MRNCKGAGSGKIDSLSEMFGSNERQKNGNSGKPIGVQFKARQGKARQGTARMQLKWEMQIRMRKVQTSDQCCNQLAQMGHFMYRAQMKWISEVFEGQVCFGFFNNTNSSRVNFKVLVSILAPMIAPLVFTKERKQKNKTPKRVEDFCPPMKGRWMMKRLVCFEQKALQKMSLPAWDSPHICFQSHQTVSHS